MRYLISHRTKTVFFPGLIIILPFILFWRWVIKGEVLFWGTLLFQFWPWHHLVKLNLLEGHLPLWNPLLGNGTPLLANLQSAVFYPPNLIYLILPVEQAMTLSTILHLLLAGLFMYGYTRQLGLLPFAAATSAITYMFSGYIVGRTQFIVMTNAAAWFPLLLLLSDKIIETSAHPRRRLLNTLWLALVLAIQLLAGHAQLWFYGLCLIGLYTLFRSWQASNKQISESHLTPSTAKSLLSSPYARRLKQILTPLLLLAVAVFLAILLTAVQILPTAEFVSQSPRSEGAGRDFALTYSFWPWRLLTLLAPNFFGNPAQDNYWGYSNYWEDHAYLGVLPFVLALVAIWHELKFRLRLLTQRPKVDPDNVFLRPDQDRSRAVIPFFALLIPISLVLALGWNTPVYLWVFDMIPGFGFFQGPARLLIWYTLAMAILAGLGAQLFESTSENRPNWRRFLAGCVAITLASIALKYGGQAQLTGRLLTFLTATQTLGVLLILSVTLLLIRPGKSAEDSDSPLKDEANAQTNGGLTRMITETSWQWILILFISIDLIRAALPLIPTTSAVLFRQPIASAEFLKSEQGNNRFFVDDDFAYATTFNQYFRFNSFGPVETGYWQSFKELLVPNFGVYAGLPSANNNDPLVVGNWQRLIDLIEASNTDLQARLLSLMSVGYFINAAESQSWPLIQATQQSAIQRNPAPLPRAYFVPRATFAQTIQDAQSRLTALDFDSRQEVVIMGLEADTSLADGDSAPFDAQSVTVKDLSVNRLQLEIDVPDSGFVILTDTFYPGWQATLDGLPTPIYQANLNFRAVRVEAGSHLIEFRYAPFSFTFGLWTSIITCLIIMLKIIFLYTKS